MEKQTEGRGQPARMTWQEAVAQLTEQRYKAENYAGLLRKYGDEAQIARGRLTYINAKADADAVIAGLITALSTGQPPESLSSLQARLSSSVSGLAQLGEMVSKLLPDTAGQKDILVDIVKGAIEPLLKKLSDGVSTLYNNYRTDKAQTRGTIKTQLEAARWLEFSEVKPAQ
jgi:hypothetical protein